MTSPVVPSIEIHSPSFAASPCARTSPWAGSARDLAGADDARLAHAARDDGGVRRAPPRVVRIPAAACMPAMSSGDVSSRTRTTGSPFAAISTAFRAVSATRPHAAPGTGGQALAEQPPLLDRGGLLLRREDRREELDELLGLDARDRLVRVDEPLVDHVGRDAHRGEARPLAVARLEQEELSILDRELEVLHVAEALLEPLANELQLRVRLRHRLLERASRSRPGSAAAASGCRRRRPRPARSGGTRRRTSSRRSRDRA